jgi:hypothetical protein
VELTSGQHRLEQVRGVHRPLGGAGPDDRVELIDEQDDLALGVLDLLEDRLQALLELAAKLSPGDQGTEIERDHALVLEAFGDIATDVKKGASIDVPEDVAKSLLEQVDNWQRAEKPKPQTQKDKV